MPISTPSQITVPFATSGLKNAIPAASNPVTGNAGYDAGFPATNMTPKEAGGIPPFGQDFNGILFDITTAIRYLEAGMQFPYSSAFATAVGGYPLGAIVTRTDGTGFWRNTVANNTTDPEAFGAGWSPEGAGISTVAMSNANVTLTALQAARPVIIITGTLSANLNLIFPIYQRQWTIINNASGAFSVTCKTASGGGATVATSGCLIAYGNGTDLVAIPLGSTGTTAPQFDNTTKFATTAFVQGVGLQFSTVIGLASATTLTSTAAGALVYSASTSPFNVTLPTASSMPSKTTITFFNSGGGGTMTLVCAGSDIIKTEQNVTTYQLVTGRSVTLVSNGSTEWSAIGSQNTNGVTGTFKNLVGSSTGLNALTSFSADEIMVSSAAGFYQTLRSVSIAPSLASSGVNGLDTGASTASTWYSVWVIWNGTTTAGLLSLSATAPTMPSGYTHKARVGWVRTDGTANKYPLGFTQGGRNVQYKVGSGTNLAALPLMASGVSGNPATPTWSMIVVGGFSPSTAIAINGTINPGSTTGPMTGIVAPNNSYGGYTSNTNSPPVVIASGSGSTPSGVFFKFVLESANIYWASSGISYVYCVGWEDNL